MGQSAMKNVTVYRLEDRNTGQGAYGALFFPCRPRLGATARHPVPDDDFKLMDGIRKFASEHKVDPIQTWNRYGRADGDPLDGQALFGFTTKSMLRRWFDRKDRQNMTNSRVEMVISVYEVHPSAVIAGSTQAIFFPQCARRVRTLPVKTREI